MDKKERKLIGGSTFASNELEFCTIKRFKDGKKRKITVHGVISDFENGNIKFFVYVKEKKYLFLKTILVILEFLLLIYFRKFIMKFYFISLIIQLLVVTVCVDFSLKQLHGAEHMVINSYISENSKIKSIDMVKKYSIISDECGITYFSIKIFSFVIMILTKLPIVLGLLAYILFKIPIIRNIFSYFERLSVKKPNDKQLYFASVTFNLLIDILEKDLGDKEEIEIFAKEYEESCNELLNLENNEIFSV